MKARVFTFTFLIFFRVSSHKTKSIYNRYDEKYLGAAPSLQFGLILIQILALLKKLYWFRYGGRFVSLFSLWEASL